jgi:hypothetical protein
VVKDLIERVLSYIPTYLQTFASVLTRPKTFAATQRGDEANRFRDGLVFLGISIVVQILLAWNRLPAEREAYEAAGTQALIVAVSMALGMAQLLVAWRLVGGRAPAINFAIIYCYFVGVWNVTLSVLLVLGLGAFKFLDQPIYDAYIASLHAHAPEPPGLEASAGFRSLVLVFVAGVLLVSVWMFLAWGAWRELNGLSRWRSFVAAIIVLVTAIPTVAITLFLAFGLQP